MPSDAINRATRIEWRALGFFYDRDDDLKQWRLVGSRSGLLRFRDILRQYVADPRNTKQSEHEHYGPYMYLEVMTWPEPGFDHHAIRGTLPDFERLAELVECKLSAATPGSTLCIREEYAKGTPYSLVLEVKSEGFDAASADPMLPAEAS